MRSPRKSVSATELASMATCEYRVVLDRRYGKKASRRSRRQRLAGDRAHAQHHREVLRYARQPRDRRCFIATAVFGPDSWQVRRLRQWRDERLLQMPGGRLLVTTYYTLSPALAGWVEKHPAIARNIRRLLERFITWI